MSSKASVLLLKGGKKDGSELDSDLSEICGSRDYDVTCIPVLDFHFINSERLYDALHKPDEYSCLVLTSRRAVEAIANAVPDKDHLKSVWTGKTTFVVGSSTGRSAEDIGLTVKGSESGNAEKLANILIKDIAGDGLAPVKPVLFPCGNLKLEFLPKALQEAGIGVQCITVYETSADVSLKCNLETLIKDKGYADYVVFYSPSGVKFAYDVLHELGFFSRNTVKLVAIGPSTENAILLHGGIVWGTSAKPTAEHLLQLLETDLNRIRTIAAAAAAQ